ncbi:MAG: response regulator transcription factor [Pseudomonadota bacterium]
MIIKILVADYHKLTRKGLVKMLNDQPEMEVIGEAENGPGVLEQTARLSPDIVVMDVNMPNLDSIELTRFIRELTDAKVIALSAHAGKRFIRGMIKAGASGYLLKTCEFDELVYAIHSVVEGHAYLAPEIASVFVKEYLVELSKEDGSSKQYGLTIKERMIIMLIAEGMPLKKIASHCNVSIKTVETHKRHIMEKLGLGSTADITRYAIQNELTSLKT